MQHSETTSFFNLPPASCLLLQRLHSPSACPKMNYEVDKVTIAASRERKKENKLVTGFSGFLISSILEYHHHKTRGFVT